MYNNCFGQKNRAGLNILTIPHALKLEWVLNTTLKTFHLPLQLHYNFLNICVEVTFTFRAVCIQLLYLLPRKKFTWDTIKTSILLSSSNFCESSFQQLNWIAEFSSTRKMASGEYLDMLGNFYADVCESIGTVLLIASENFLLQFSSFSKLTSTLFKQLLFSKKFQIN